MYQKNNGGNIVKNSNELQVVKIPNQPLYRYMSIKRLDEIFKNQSIRLHRINKFEDIQAKNY